MSRLATPPAWLNALADPERVATSLSSRVPELRSGALRLEELEVKRLRIKNEWRRGTYRVTVADAGSGAERVIDLRAEFSPPGGPPTTVPSEGTPFASEGWRLSLPELGLDLMTEPPDTDLPALPALTDPGESRRLLQQAIRDCSPRHAGLRILWSAPNVVRYKRGSRCTVVYALELPGDADPTWPRTVVAKTYWGNKGRNAYEAMRALWRSNGAGTVVRLAEPLAFVPELNVLVQAGIPHQRTLKELLRSTLADGSEQARDRLGLFLAKTGRGLAELHASAVDARGTVTWDDEVAEIREVVARLGALVPGVGDAVNPLLARLEALAAKHPPGALVPSHRSFRPAQVLIDGTEIGFIDFDGFCRAEPALDVALFRATLMDIGLRALRARSSSPDAEAEYLAQLDGLRELFTKGYEAVAPISRERVVLWETLDLLTAVLHCWTKLKFERLDHRLRLLRHHLSTGPIAGAAS